METTEVASSSSSPSPSPLPPSVRHTCLKLELPVEDPKATDAAAAVFVKGTWFPSRFDLAVSDGLSAWTCNATEAEVRLRAERWDQSSEEYVALAERYLGFQHPDSKYGFDDAGNGQRRLSWTFEKHGTKLEWRWKCQPSPNNKQTTAGILDFLMDANIRLSEEVLRKTQSFENMKTEADSCLLQSEKFKEEQTKFESAVYAKFVAVLNSKKAKLRELRDRISQLEAGKAPKEEDDSTDKTESFDEESDSKAVKDELDEEKAGTSGLKGRRKRSRK